MRLQPISSRSTYATGASAPVVSVCIANWNCEALLRACLHSLESRSQGVPFEVIVVDNASTDGAVAMIRERFPHVTLICNSTNRGFSAANNQAAAVARGAYLFFLNNDTLVPPNTLRDFVEFCEENPNVGMIGPRLRDGAGELQISYRRKPTLEAMLHRISLLRWTCWFRRAYYDYRRDTFNPNGTHVVDALMGAAVFLPRDAFDASGRWDETYRFGGEDLDLSLQVGRERAVVYVGSVEIIHYGRVASRENIAFAAPNVAIGYVHYFRKDGEPEGRLRLYKLLVTLDTPLQLLGKVVQAGGRLLRGERDKAGKSWTAAKGLFRFLTHELARFWRA